ncbi:helix-turn-helix domain-containing protein, partial [Streptomyces sp. 7R007]
MADTIRKWRRRLRPERLESLADESRTGRPPTIRVRQMEAVVVTTLEQPAKSATHWYRGLSKSTGGRWATSLDAALASGPPRVR